jgi:hypothetical protein
MSRYEAFFSRDLSQKGGGYTPNYGHFFNSPPQYQRGKGLGGIFSKVIKFLAPYLLDIGKTVGSELQNSAGEIISNIGKRPMSEMLSEQTNRALKSLAAKGAERLQNFSQRGSRPRKYLLNDFSLEKTPLIRKTLSKSKAIKRKPKKRKVVKSKRKVNKRKKKVNKTRKKRAPSKKSTKKKSKNILKKLFSAAGV